MRLMPHDILWTQHVHRCSMGLADEFGKSRVFNTPLTEQGAWSDMD